MIKLIKEISQDKLEYAGVPERLNIPPDKLPWNEIFNGNMRKILWDQPIEQKYPEKLQPILDKLHLVMHNDGQVSETSFDSNVFIEEYKKIIEKNPAIKQKFPTEQSYVETQLEKARNRKYNFISYLQSKLKQLPEELTYDKYYKALIGAMFDYQIPQDNEFYNFIEKCHTISKNLPFKDYPALRYINQLSSESSKRHNSEFFEKMQKEAWEADKNIRKNIKKFLEECNIKSDIRFDPQEFGLDAEPDSRDDKVSLSYQMTGSYIVNTFHAFVGTLGSDDFDFARITSRFLKMYFGNYNSSIFSIINSENNLGKELKVMFDEENKRIQINQYKKQALMIAGEKFVTNEQLKSKILKGQFNEEIIQQTVDNLKEAYKHKYSLYSPPHDMDCGMALQFVKTNVEKLEKKSAPQEMNARTNLVASTIRSILSFENIKSTLLSEFNDWKQAPISVLMLSRSPIDVLRMSDFPNIQSCHSPKNEGEEYYSYYQCAINESFGNGFVAYELTQDNAKSITDLNKSDVFKDLERDIEGFYPISRMRMRKIRVKFNDGEIITMFMPESRRYGVKGDEWGEGAEEIQDLELPQDNQFDGENHWGTVRSNKLTPIHIALSKFAGSHQTEQIRQIKAKGIHNIKEISLISKYNDAINTNRPEELKNMFYLVSGVKVDSYLFKLDEEGNKQFYDYQANRSNFTPEPYLKALINLYKIFNPEEKEINRDSLIIKKEDDPEIYYIYNMSSQRLGQIDIHSLFFKLKNIEFYENCLEISKTNSIEIIYFDDKTKLFDLNNVNLYELLKLSTRSLKTEKYNGYSKVTKYFATEDKTEVKYMVDGEESVVLKNDLKKIVPSLIVYHGIPLTAEYTEEDAYEYLELKFRIIDSRYSYRGNVLFVEYENSILKNPNTKQRFIDYILEKSGGQDIGLFEIKERFPEIPGTTRVISDKIFDEASNQDTYDIQYFKSNGAEELHNLEGPAVICVAANNISNVLFKEYWINGKQIREHMYNTAVRNEKLKNSTQPTIEKLIINKKDLKYLNECIKLEKEYVNKTINGLITQEDKIKLNSAIFVFEQITKTKWPISDR